MNRLLMSAGLMLASATCAYAQQQPPATTPAPQQPPAVQAPPPAATQQKTQPTPDAQRSAQPAREAKGDWSAKDLMDSSIYNAQGERVGEVNDIIIGQDGKVMSYVVGVGGFLGIGEKEVALSPDKVQRTIQSDGNMRFVVNTTKQELEAAPKYARPRAR